MSTKPQITSWSFSRWAEYEKCPLRAKLKFIDKLKEPSGPALEKGVRVHQLAQDYVEGTLKRLPLELKLFAQPFRDLKKIGAKCEQDWAFTTRWEPTGWFAPDAWLRVKTDVVYVDDADMTVIDHKTGKQYPDHATQLELYALAGFLVVPEAGWVHAHDWYLDTGLTREGTFSRCDTDTLKKEWLQRTKPMLKDTKFCPRPGSHCRWCIFKKEEGGQCPY